VVKGAWSGRGRGCVAREGERREWPGSGRGGVAWEV